jgi:hypothetical protein
LGVAGLRAGGGRGAGLLQILHLPLPLVPEHAQERPTAKQSTDAKEDAD